MARRKGAKRIKVRDDTNIINSYGVKFTRQEVKDFNKKVANVNAKRERIQRKALEAQPVRNIGYGRLPKDVVLSPYKRRSGVSTFKSREEFDEYRSRTFEESRKGAMGDIVRRYKRNYSEALIQAYGHEGYNIKPILAKIKRMPHDKFMKIVNNQELPGIDFVYNEEVKEEALQEIADALGMNDLDDYDLFD